MNPILNEISENLQKGKAKIVKELVEKALVWASRMASSVAPESRAA